MTALFPIADRIGEYIGLPPLARPAMIPQATVKLTRRDFWSDCAICDREVNHCDCDPNAYADALLAKFRKGEA